MRKSMMFIGLSAIAAVACSATPVVVQNHIQQSQNVTQSTKTETVTKLTSVVAATTPPAGATPASSPPTTVAGKALPIVISQTTVVYTFQMNVDDDSALETLFWVATDEGVFVWGKIGLHCVDDDGKATGETGDADFVYARKANGEYGWLTGTDACGYTTKYGCSGSSSAEVCGGCDYNESFIACSAIAQTN